MDTIKISGNAKNPILAFIKNIVSKTLFQAIKLLLEPCCPVNSIDGVTFTAATINGNLLSNRNVTVVIIADGVSPFYVGKGTTLLNNAGSGTL